MVHLFAAAAVRKEKGYSSCNGEPLGVSRTTAAPVYTIVLAQTGRQDSMIWRLCETGSSAASPSTGLSSVPKGIDGRSRRGAADQDGVRAENDEQYDNRSKYERVA